MKDKVKVGLALALCLIACLVIEYFYKYVFDFVIFLLSILAVKEFAKLQLKSGMPTYSYCPEVACCLVFLTSFVGFLCGLSAIIILLIVIAVVVAFYLIVFLGGFLFFSKQMKDDKFRDVANMSVKRFAFFKANNTLASILYPTLMMFFLYYINHIDYLGLSGLDAKTGDAPMGLFGLVLLFSITVLTDTFAMLFGTWIKGKKIFPKISPKKTLSGALFGLLGGIIGATITYIIFGAIFSQAFFSVHFWQFIIIGFVGSIVAQAGDLFESFVKRKANVKDAGDFFRSHGGVLDRLDSAIFVAPYVFICLLFLFA